MSWDLPWPYWLAVRWQFRLWFIQYVWFKSVKGDMILLASFQINLPLRHNYYRSLNDIKETRFTYRFDTLNQEICSLWKKSSLHIRIFHWSTEKSNLKPCILLIRISFLCLIVLLLATGEVKCLLIILLLLFPGWSQRTRTINRPEEMKPSDQDLGSSEYEDKGKTGKFHDIYGNTIEVFGLD